MFGSVILYSEGEQEMDNYIYFISFVGLLTVGGCIYGNCVLTFSRPISCLKDIQDTEAYIKTAPNKVLRLESVSIINLQLLGRALASERMILN
jgi:hypothetical protein